RVWDVGQRDVGGGGSRGQSKHGPIIEGIDQVSHRGDPRDFRVGASGDRLRDKRGMSRPAPTVDGHGSRVRHAASSRRAESATDGKRAALAGTWRKSRERTRLAPAKATRAAAPAHTVPDRSRLSRRSSEYLPPPAL